ncbi:IS4 family transposase [Paraburkholderia sp. 32]|uniref:IS4 family transposase n=1 Tax=Paraburkholderia sp. 32 TaxID=2991057 RepID=UPI003D1BB9ED
MTTRGVCDHEVTMMTSVMRGFLRDRKGARDEFLNIARQRVLTMLQAEHYHDISCGHRVYGNEGKCQNLHGHNYRIHFACEAASLDDLGRIIDFGSIKTLLCDWVENHWDHRMLLWRIARLMRLGRTRPELDASLFFHADEIRGEFLLAKKPRPKTPITLDQIIRLISSLGGLLRRKSDGEPGAKTLWIGMQRTMDAVSTIQALREDDS